MVSVLILTRDEQRDLPGCLASVSWSDDIHVFDSQSTDATIEIAQAAGAHVHTRPFDDYATHRNAALATIPFKHPWLLLLDADERPTPASHPRRLDQKAIFSRMPARPFLKWLYMVLARGAILDGAAGLTYAPLQPFYEYLIVLNPKEIPRGGA